YRPGPFHESAHRRSDIGVAVPRKLGRVMTYSVPSGAPYTPPLDRSAKSGKIGMVRISLPSGRTALGLRTDNRPRSQTTSPHLSSTCSEGQRRPPNPVHSCDLSRFLGAPTIDRVSDTDKLSAAGSTQAGRPLRACAMIGGGLGVPGEE